jgi:hypothetical protein
MKPKNEEYDNFDAMMKKLIAVPHDEIKRQLDAEKRSREKKRKARKPSASGRASVGED